MTDIVISLPESLLALTGAPDSWQRNSLGMSGAQVYYLSQRDAWLKYAPTGIRAEADVLRYLGGKVPAPCVRYYAEDHRYQYLVMSSLHGLPLCAAEALARPEHVVRILAEALRELHALDVRACPLDRRLAVTLPAGHYPDEEYAWLTHDPPLEELVVTHGDACLPNFLCANDAYTGCLDLSNAGVADRWQDLAYSLWSLQYNLGTPDWGLPFLDAYGIAPDRRRIAYYLRLNQIHGPAVL
jgi:aminoglycoside phosphotransferase